MNAPQVQSLHHAATDTWSHLVADAASGSALIIDPVLDFEASSGQTGSVFAQGLLDAATNAGYRIEWILETHAHADHLSSAAWLKTRIGARTGIGIGIRDVQRAFKPIFNLDDSFPSDGSQFDHLFVDGERFMLGGIDCQVIATPGHTSDSVSYLIGDALFVGDSLFMPEAGTARCDFPGGDAATLFASIQRLYALPDDTRVFVCHDYPADGRAARAQTSIGAEKAGNIHLREATREAEFVAHRQARDATLSMPALILPSLQVNIRAGELPPPECDGSSYLKIPLNRNLNG